MTSKDSPFIIAVHWSGVTRYTWYYYFASSCVFDKQSGQAILIILYNAQYYLLPVDLRPASRLVSKGELV